MGGGGGLFAGGEDGGAGAGEEGGAAGAGGARGRLGRPMTARRRPPKVQDSVTAGGVAGGGPGHHQGQVQGLLGEGGGEVEEEVEEGGAGGADATGASAGAGHSAMDAGHGKHTRDILARVGGAKAGAGLGAGESKEGEGADGGDGGIRMGRLGATGKRAADAAAAGAGRGLSAREVEALRAAVQDIVRVANPLGKGLEYAREDMDEMRRELAHWRNEARRKAQDLDAAARRTDEVLEPLRDALRAADAQCRDVESKIAEMQAAIAFNDRRLAEILGTIVRVDMP